MSKKIAGSGSGSISQRHGSADPDPDPYQNVMDLQHWKITGISFRLSGPENGCSLSEGGVE
jgi:hypothetical protein